MVEDDGKVEPRAIASREQFDEALLYDYAKFLTTLSLLGLGGVLTLTQTADSEVAKPGLVAFIVISIAMAGAHSVAAAARLAKVELGRPGRITAPTMIRIATAFLGLGTGGFLMMWWKSLGA